MRTFPHTLRCILFVFLPILFNSLGYAQITDERPDYEKDSLQVIELLDIQYELYWQEQLDSILQISYTIQDIAEKWKDEPFFAACQVMIKATIGQVYCMQGHYTKGLPMMESTLKDIRNLGYISDDAKFRVSRGFVGLGWIFEEVGDLEKALECHIQAERMQRELVERKVIPLRWLVFKARNLGDIYFKLGQYDLSEQLHKKAVVLANEVWGKCSEFQFLSNLAALYLKIGATAKADKTIAEIELQLEYDHCPANKDIRSIGFLQRIGSAYFDQDSFAIAASMLEKAIALEEKHTPWPPEVVVVEKSKMLYVLAKSQLAMDQPVQALATLERVKAIWLESNNPQNDFWYQLELLEGEIRLAQKKWPLAIRKFETVLQGSLQPFFSQINYDEIKEWPVSPWIMQALRGRLEALYGQEQRINQETILHEATLAQNYLEQLLLTFSTDYSRSRTFTENRSVYDIPIHLSLQQYQSAKDPQYLDQLHYHFEKSKALQLLSTVKDKQLQSTYGVSDQLLAEVNSVRREVSFCKNKIAEIYRDTAEQQELKKIYQQRLWQLNTSFDSLQLILQKEYPSYYNLKYNLTVVKLADLRQTLSPDEALISYYWSPEQLYAMAVSRQNTNVWTIPLNREFLHPLNAYRQFIITPPAQEANPALIQETFDLGLQLFQSLLLPALKDQDETRKIILLPDGPLGYLPWAALPTGKISREVSLREFPFLIKQFTLQQEYSATLLRTDIPRTKLEIPYIGVAPDYQDKLITSIGIVDTLQLRSAFGQDFRFAYGPLQYNLPEIENAGKLYEKGIQLLGKEATENQFKQYAGHGNILHLAMHAATNDKDPMLSHLVFSADPDSLEDDILYAYELYNMNIPSELAILSACNTGAGKMLDGQGVMSLARAFKYAGCRDVLMTHWPAHDRSTAKLINGFFHYYQEENLSKAESLQKSTLDYLQQESNEILVHPYYWAGFTLIGTGDPAGTSFNWLLILAIGGSVLLLFLILNAFRRRANN